MPSPSLRASAGRAPIAACLAAAAAIAAAADSPFAIDVEALKAQSPPPGTLIDAGNIDAHAAIVDENFAQMIRDGLATIEVAEPFSLEPHAVYQEATRAHAGQVTLGDAPGVINGYVAGLPFPEAPDANDPRAGDKLAWNFRYAWGADSGELEAFYWQYRDMRKNVIERELSFYGAQMRLMHRHLQEPVPAFPNNPSQIYNALYLLVLAPPDIRRTQLLIHRPEDDTARDATWLYLGGHRRVRRLASGQTTDSFLGSDIMIEDFIGYNGRLSDMTWTFHGARVALLPFFDRAKARLVDATQPQQDGFKFAGFAGTGGCFPDVTWQLRPVYVLEAVPKAPEHPLSKRRFFVDAQSHAAAYGNLYDRNGKLWKIGYAAFAHPDTHLPENQGMGFPVVDAATMIDVQAMHCTTLQFKARAGAKGLDPNDFVVQALRAKGR